MSFINKISKPQPCNARIAVSLPLPGPHITTSAWRMPESKAWEATFSATDCAANGVLFLAPLKPHAPAEDQNKVLPCLSVILTIVLLNVDRICTNPVDFTFLDLLLLNRFVCLIIYHIKFSDG